MNAASTLCVEQAAEPRADYSAQAVNRLANLLAIVRREQQAIVEACTVAPSLKPSSEDRPAEAK
ncbi:MAG: hypothetical protein QM775_22940 [Pirellulales bacterium]